MNEQLPHVLRSAATGTGRSEGDKVLLTSAAYEIERLTKKIEMLKYAIRRFVPAGKQEKALCMHEGYSFNKHGRCCPHCGDVLTDFGD